MQNVKISQQILERLFESPLKIKLLKLFLRNDMTEFSFSEICDRLLANPEELKQELHKLHEIRFINTTKMRNHNADNNNADQEEEYNEQEYLYSLNSQFIFFDELQNLILKSSPADEDKLTKQIQGLGNIHLAILSGIFMKPNRIMSRTDLLIVSDSMSNRKFSSFIKILEAEVGAEINYTILTTHEYEYRTQMFDRFLLDIFEKPHKILLEKTVVAQ